jgi:hypothetical protein
MAVNWQICYGRITEIELRLPQSWVSSAGQGMTGQLCRRLSTEDEAGFAFDKN